MKLQKKKENKFKKFKINITIIIKIKQLIKLKIFTWVFLFYLKELEHKIDILIQENERLNA